MIVEFSFLSQFGSGVTAATLFVVMVVAFWLGFKVARRDRNKNSGFNFGPVEGSLLGLLALLLAFTFSIAAARFDERRKVLIEEAEYIGTAILRADLYDEAERAAFRADFKEYVEARIAFFSDGMVEERVEERTKVSNDISGRIWERAARLAQNRDNLIPSNQMVPALNEMIDVVTTRNALRQATVPDSIMWMLFALCIISSFIVGLSREQKEKSWIVNVVFAMMISGAIFLIVDLDRPVRGLITLDAENQHMIELRKIFESGP